MATSTLEELLANDPDYLRDLQIIEQNAKAYNDSLLAEEEETWGRIQPQIMQQLANAGILDSGAVNAILVSERQKLSAQRQSRVADYLARGKQEASQKAFQRAERLGSEKYQTEETKRREQAEETAKGIERAFQERFTREREQEAARQAEIGRTWRAQQEERQREHEANIAAQQARAAEITSRWGAAGNLGSAAVMAKMLSPTTTGSTPFGAFDVIAGRTPVAGQELTGPAKFLMYKPLANLPSWLGGGTKALAPFQKAGMGKLLGSAGAAYLGSQFGGAKVGAWEPQVGAGLGGALGFGLTGGNPLGAAIGAFLGKQTGEGLRKLFAGPSEWKGWFGV